MGASPATINHALLEYQRGDLTKDIALRHDTSPSSITVWATKAGLKLRRRGRRLRTEPGERDRLILRLVTVNTYEVVAKRLGISKWGVGKVVKRWKGWGAPKAPPYKKGDVVSFRRKLFTVVDAGIRNGTVRDEQGRLCRSFKWVVNGQSCVRVEQKPARKTARGKSGS